MNLKTTGAGIIVAIVMSVHGVAAARPEWCEQDLHKADTDEERALKAPDPMDALVNLVGSSCLKERVMKSKPADLAAARARWNKELGLTDADWATDVIPWALTDQGRRNNPFITYDKKQAPTALDAIQQFGFISNTEFVGSNDPLYALDRLGPKLTMTGRLAYLQRCLDTDKPVQWALCQPDLDAFDKKQVFAEMRADKSPRGFERMAMRLAAYKLKDKIAKRQTQIKELVAKDQAWSQLFAVSADAHKEWAANPPDATILALASAMDDASATNSTKAFAGCEDATWAGFSTAVGALPAAKFKDFKDGEVLSGVIGVLINDRNAYLAAVALVTCRAQKPDALDRYLSAAMIRWPGFRGPRSFALTKLITSSIALDDRSARIDYPQVNRRFNGTSMSGGGGGAGLVAKVKPNGAKTHVEFVKKLQKVKVCTAWKYTSRIEQITTTGAVIYHSDCTKYGMDTINNASAPTDVDTKYAEGLKPGTIVQIVASVVVAVSPKPGAAPTRVFGIAVK
jgi:hypothetical protein